MKIRTFIAAALVAGATTPFCHAGEKTAYREVPAASSAGEGTARKADGQSANLLRDLLRGGRARRDGEAVPVDTVTTASVPRAAARAGKAAVKGRKGAGDGGAYRALIARYASTYGVPVPLATAIVRVESNFRAGARGAAGEIGLMQIKPSTARMMGYRGSAKGLYHPDTNIKYGMKYLAKAHQLSGGTTCGTILKYNAGHGAKRMNRVSSAYCSKVKRMIGR